MSDIYTSTQMIADVRDISTQPDAEQLLTSARILTFLSFQLTGVVAPLVDSVNAEYFVTFYDIAWSNTQFIFDIPTRSMGNKLKDVVFVDANGNEYSIPQLTPEQLKVNGYYGLGGPGYGVGAGTGSSLYGFFLKDDKIVLYLGQSNGTNGFPTLRIKYYRRPSRLCLAENAGEITQIIPDNNQVIVSVAPLGFSDGDSCDFIKGTPMFTSRGDDFTMTSISSTTLTFTALPSSLAVGDWVSLANTSPIPQIPYEGFPLLTQLGTIKCLEAIKDSEGLKNALEVVPELKTAFLQTIAPRVDSNPIVLQSNTGIFNA